MAGYKKPKKTYHLTFEDPELDGFEITMGSLSIAQFTELTNTFSTVQAAGKPDAPVQTSRSADAVTALLRKFADSIISWNLEDEAGQLIPPTFEGVQTQELGFIMQILMAWMDAIAGVDPTSQANANGSGTFPEASLPMEPLPVSLPN